MASQGDLPIGGREPVAFLFDVGDTLVGFPVGSWEEIDRESLRALLAALDRRVRPPPDLEEALRWYREVVFEAQREAFPERREVRASDCLRRLLERMGMPPPADDELKRLERIWAGPRLGVRRVFADVPEVLAGLAGMGVRLGLISNIWLSGTLVREHLARMGLARFFDVIILSSEVGFVKPHPEPFRRALAQIGVPPERAWHVGDNPHADVAGAFEVGIHPVLIRRPPYPGQQPAFSEPYLGPPPELVVDSLYPLIDLARSLLHASGPARPRPSG